jgi:predicted RNA-binding protein with RPS1 domain
MHESDAHEHRPEAQPPPQDAAPEHAIGASGASDSAGSEPVQSPVAEASSEPAEAAPEPVAATAEPVETAPEPVETVPEPAATVPESAATAQPVEDAERSAAEAGTDAPVSTEPSAAAHEAHSSASQPTEAHPTASEGGVDAVPSASEAVGDAASPASESSSDTAALPFDAPPEADRAPVAEAPAPVISAEAAVGDAPVADAPVAEAPGAEAPAAETSVAEAPAPEAPAAEAPAAEAPAAETAPSHEAAAATPVEQQADATSADVPGTAEAAGAAPAVEPPRKPQPSPQEIARNEERRKRAQQAWERVVSARESGEVLTGTVTTAVKGGLLVDVGGIRGFLPASQVRVPQGTAIDTLVKTKVPLKVIDIDQNRRRIVVSHRRAAEEERRTKRAEVLRSLEVGQTREGTVVRLTDFGAFVDLGGVDGLIPMRELAFERVEKAGDVVKVGEVLPVEVLRIDENGKKISLSRRNALPDPWRDHADVLRQGKTVEGKVVGKEPRLQVEIAPGVVGTVRESDADPADYEVGEAIEVIVRRADRATRRIMLSTTHTAAAAPPPQTTSSGFAPLGVELGRRT